VKFLFQRIALVKYKTRGDLNTAKIGFPINYFAERDTFLDAWGPIDISPLSQWGVFNTVLTASHSTNPHKFGEVVFKPVIVHDKAWITTNVTLFNCEIGEGAIVSVGSVVMGRNVPAWTMVEGNPARIIARYDHQQEKWISQEPEELERRK